MVDVANYKLGVHRGPDGMEREFIMGTTNATANTRTTHAISQAKPVWEVRVRVCAKNAADGGGGLNSGSANDVALCQFPPQYFDHAATSGGLPAPTVSSFCDKASMTFVAEVIYGPEGYRGGSSV